ncbi:MAG: monovalent cation/H(+) antiporter subunit G [Mogibacterium sp.]|nr:monovalent cation/H(+) antiporter subunit G [Mogibacterium sp.]
MTATMIITAVLIILGLLFMLASLIGIAALPDFFTRLHAQGVGDTLGAFLILAGMMVAVHGGLLSVKIFLIFIIIVLTNPIGTNLMMIAAINKEDYLGYRTRMSGEEAAAEYVSPDPEPEEEPQKDEPEKSAEEKQEEASDCKPERKQEKSEKAPEGKPEKKKAPEKKPEDKTEKKQAPKKKRKRKPSMSMNKAELIKAAENRGISVPEGATKREILDLIYADKDK